MIRRIYSSDSAFKTLRFSEGFNVLIADRDPRATSLQTRNGAGKSSFLRLVHFLTGGSCNKGECMFLDPLLKEHTFGMEFDLHGQAIAVERSAARPSRVLFPKGSFSGWPVTPRRRGKDTVPSLSNEEWKAVLGARMFRLGAVTDDERAEKFIPTFRTLFAYFARQHENGAFLEPYKIHTDQQLWSQQVAVTFLIGLDWRIPQGMQMIRARERTIRQLRELIEQSGGTEGLLPRSDDLEAQLTLAKDRATRVKQSLATYRINPEYYDLEREVDALTAAISKTLDDDTFDRELVVSLEAALRAEAPPDPADLHALYQEAQVQLPGVALKRFEDIRAFHESVLRNRESYLKSELTKARSRLAKRSSERERADGRRSEIMAVLASTGALDQFTLLQAELGRLEADVATLRRQAEAAKQIEDTKLQLEIETAELELRLGRNHVEQSERIEQAQLIFADISQRLYERPGALTVSRKLSGPPVRASIHGQESVGISHMQIFCFDMTLVRLALVQGQGPGFLIHDSHLFDGVDARQVNSALRAAIEQCKEAGFQYIATLNSDKVATVNDDSLDLMKFAVPVRLTDQPTGGLFGKRFG